MVLFFMMIPRWGYLHRVLLLVVWCVPNLIQQQQSLSLKLLGGLQILDKLVRVDHVHFFSHSILFEVILFAISLIYILFFITSTND